MNNSIPRGTAAAPAERTALVCRAAMRFCALRGWAPVQEMPLPNGRRADILALLPDGSFAAIEVKSCARDFLSDAKWPDYREFSDRLYFAVDLDFPEGLLPAEVGLLVVDGRDAALLREAPEHPLAPARRKALLQRYARVAAGRLAALSDPEAHAELRAALRVE
ncbi:MmcB family DNA repair protein [Paracraurococcus lichenis]|uniref:MmcB family DNA repair protein n=1 Tax=Paracraurococcus lichenis TaxID=3064888 RepID=A0ABT9DY25_9PROT|nr:MmcB family DNA repair protein [Paracraurococcus sp. LOR1-02]MDO9708786.1 MmcB family DNA repair protein [Paracraurococcus sp. LOR1-02]